jgi:hypothetical protein
MGVLLGFEIIKYIVPPRERRKHTRNAEHCHLFPTTLGKLRDPFKLQSVNKMRIVIVHPSERYVDIK